MPPQSSLAGPGGERVFTPAQEQRLLEIVAEALAERGAAIVEALRPEIEGLHCVRESLANAAAVTSTTEALFTQGQGDD